MLIQVKHLLDELNSQYYSTVLCLIIGLYKDVEDDSLLVAERKEQLEDRQKAYQWLKFPGTGVPSGIKGTMHEVPEDEKFVLLKAIDFTKTAFEAFAKLTIGGIGKGHQVKHLHDFASIARFIQPARLPLDEGNRWQYDVEFGRQMLNGVNPYIIEKCTKLPANFPVTHELVGPFLTRGLTLEQEMEVSSLGTFMTVLQVTR